MPKEKIKILLVEDESFLSEMYKTKLIQQGYDVFTAFNGVDGFKAAEEHLPDLILLDILMPQVDGYTMLKNVKANKQTKNISVIIFSNLSQKHEIEKGLTLGASDFIIKTSVTPTELASKVKEYLSKK